MTRTETQRAVADQQEHQARTGSSSHGDPGALGNAVQTIPSIVVTDCLGVARGTDTEPDACVYGSQNGEIVPSQSDIDDYVPWIATANEKNVLGVGTVSGTVNRIGYFLLLLAGAIGWFGTIVLLIWHPPPAHIDQILRVLVALSVLMSALLSYFLTSLSVGLNNLRVLGCFCFLGCLVIYAEFSVADGYKPHGWLPAWKVDVELIPFPNCATRVDASRRSLFLEPLHLMQPVNSSGSLTEGVVLSQQIYSQVSSNDTLCGQGFGGNSDLYGLGQRLGLYLQWTTALVINNLLPEGRSIFRVVYLGYSLTVCITTFVLTFTADCTFAIEIDILYWAFWGGFLCVFATSPSSTRLGSKPRWAGLDWVTGINYTLHVLMFYHAVYSWVRGYSRFARTPCGTFRFYLAPVLDPSEAYWRLRTYLSLIGLGVFVPIMLGIPIAGLILLAEIKQSICNSNFFQIVGEYDYLAQGFRSRISALSSPEQSRSSETLEALKAFMVTLGGPYRWLRMQFLLPSGARSGIRLITPLHIAQRKRYLIACRFSGLACYVLSITAIEITLRWNKVLNVDSLASVGQFWPLTIGLATFVSTVYQLLKQEAIRRRELLRRSKLSLGEEGIGLEGLRHPSFGDAITHAFERADAGFLTNDGILPAPSPIGSDGEDDIGVQGQSYVMSGAL